MSDLTITIAGKTGSGKTLIAQLVADTLRAHGLRVSNEDDNNGWTPTEIQRVGYLNRLRPSISVKTKQTPVPRLSPKPSTP